MSAIANATPTVIYVNYQATGMDDGTSWADAFLDLQDALAAACPDDEIWVAAGTYTPTSGTDQSASFDLPTEVKFYGGFEGDPMTGETSIEERPGLEGNPDPTILSGEIGSPGYADNSYHVVTADAEEGDFFLDRFTIASGGSYDEADTDSSGGGVYLNEGGLYMVDCIIRNNAGFEGGGMYVGTDGSASLLRTHFIENKAHKDGGGVFARGLFKSSHGTFLANLAIEHGGGAALKSTEESSLLNVLFYENTAGEKGGGVYNGGDLLILNCTVCENNAGDEGGGLADEGTGAYAARNSIFWANADGESGDLITDQIYPAPSTEVTYSAVKHITSGAGNIDDDPEFASAGPPCRIDTSSPCRDAGNNTDIDWYVDIDLGDRIVHSTVDMGVNELQAGACCLPGGHCEEVAAPQCDELYSCDVAELLPGTFNDCFGDADGNGTVNVADRGFISAAYAQTDPESLCMYDLNGDGVINDADRAEVSANIGLCTTLPDYQNGSGCNNSTCPDPRFAGDFQGEGTFCGMGTCTTSESLMMESGPEAGVQAGYGAWYSIILDYNEVEIDGAIVFGVSTSGAVIDDVSGGLTVVTLGGSSGSALPARQFGGGYTRREMIEIASPPSEEESGGELCSVELADGATLRLEVYLWRDNGGGDYTVWAAGLTAE
jgi:hypothetical protein